MVIKPINVNAIEKKVLNENLACNFPASNSSSINGNAIDARKITMYWGFNDRLIKYNGIYMYRNDNHPAIPILNT